MESGPFSREQATEYLRVLGVPRASPSLPALRALVTAHVTSVPFENVSKLLYRRRLGLREVPSLDRYLEGIERWHFGGTCYANNFHLWRLLQGLGYRATLCGAAMRSGVDVHAVITVAIGGRELLVDAGYAAPFLEPLPLDRGRDVVVARGRDRYVLEPRDAQGRSSLVFYRDGARLHGYTLSPTPRTEEHFRSVVADLFRAEATFMNAVMVVRFKGATSAALHNFSLVRSAGSRSSVEHLPNRHAVVEAIEREFGIPAELASEALAGVELRADPYG